MRKKTVFIVLIALLCFLVFSFGRIYNDINFDTYRKVSSVKEGNTSLLQYQDEKYYYLYPADFFVDLDETTAVELGWNFNFPFSACDIYYSYTSDNPEYIYSSVMGVYINTDYDYKSDIFTVEGTDLSIVFSDAFTENSIDYDIFKADVVSFNLRSKSHPELYTKVSAIKENDVYYMTIDLLTAYEISEEFLDMLVENGIIP